MGLIDKIIRRRAPAPEAAAPLEARSGNFAEPGIDGILRLIGSEALSERVTLREAFSLPSMFAARNFMAQALSSLPIHVYQRAPEGEADQRIDHPVARLFAIAANDELPGYEFLNLIFSDQFGPGRGYALIERNARGEVTNLWPMEYERTIVRRTPKGAILYDYTRADGTMLTYPSRDVIDLAFKRCADLISGESPALACAAALRQGLNASRYALTVFGKNGIPPYVLQGAMPTGDAARRASEDVAKVARRQAQDGQPILPLPSGYELKRLGDDPEKMQLTSVQVFVVQQVARIYGLPPVFLQELSTGTYSNTEQQDLHLVKHTLAGRAVQVAAAMSLKIFGRDSDLYLKIDLDAISRGVFKDRIEAIARAINSGQLTPNEGRELRGLGPKPGGDDLLIQSATVPLALLGEKMAAEIGRGTPPALPPIDPEETDPNAET